MENNFWIEMNVFVASVQPASFHTPLVTLIGPLTLYDASPLTSSMTYASESRKIKKLFPPGGRADPGGSAIPGRPVVGEEQAPTNLPGSKNQLISKIPFGIVPEIKPIRTDTTL